ncbi:hypothetical protein M8C21_013833, partial [Ambrosia artemisiifolia]
DLISNLADQYKTAVPLTSLLSVLLLSLPRPGTLPFSESIFLLSVFGGIELQKNKNKQFMTLKMAARETGPLKEAKD